MFAAEAIYPTTKGGLSLPPAIRDTGEAAPDFVYKYLKELIVTLEVTPRTVITEMMVASAVDVSRTPVRQAFLRLAAERLIEIVPRRGAVVTPISLRQLRELADTRAVLEEHSAKVICERRLEIASQLDHWVERQKFATSAPVPNELEVMQADRSFHQAIVFALGNTELSTLYQSLGDRQMRTGIALFRANPARMKMALDHHVRIVDALRTGDAEQAQKEIREHLLGSLGGLEMYFPD